MPNTQKSLRLYKVERYQIDFVLAENESEAESSLDIDLTPNVSVDEIKELSPSETGYDWRPINSSNGYYSELTCGEWLEENKKRLQEEEEKNKLRESALRKLTDQEKAVILEWASSQS